MSAPPYDVLDVDQARALAGGNPNSFLHVSRPEIDLPDDVNPYDARVYQQGRRALADFVARRVLVRDGTAGYLVYRQRWRNRCQTGIVGCACVADYESGVIRTHEHTRPDKERDRVRHIDALSAHDEPVFLLTPPNATVEAVVAQVTAGPPTYDFTSDDAVTHTLWTVQDGQLVQALRSGFDAVTRLYVADGHHRSAAALTVHRARAARHPVAVEDEAFLAVAFPTDQVQILAYNRVVANLTGQTPQNLLDALAKAFEIIPTRQDPVVPDRRHDLGMYLADAATTGAGGQWFRLRARAEVVDGTDPISRLDVALLHDQVLAPLLGISDPRTDDRIQFVSGAHGTAELVRLVDSGAAAVAFSLHPTSMEELLAVADTGAVMPPKSTWFEPKPRSGLFLHPLDPPSTSRATPAPQTPT
jgi:uncharacterized protein (DUF1015 family)